jgi:hypothetical protein
MISYSRYAERIFKGYKNYGEISKFCRIRKMEDRE